MDFTSAAFISTRESRIKRLVWKSPCYLFTKSLLEPNRQLPVRARTSFISQGWRRCPVHPSAILLLLSNPTTRQRTRMILSTHPDLVPRILRCELKILSAAPQYRSTLLRWTAGSDRVRAEVLPGHQILETMSRFRGTGRMRRRRRSSSRMGRGGFRIHMVHRRRAVQVALFKCWRGGEV